MWASVKMYILPHYQSKVKKMYWENNRCVPAQGMRISLFLMDWWDKIKNFTILAAKPGQHEWLVFVCVLTIVLQICSFLALAQLLKNCVCWGGVNYDTFRWHYFIVQPYRSESHIIKHQQRTQTKMFSIYNQRSDDDDSSVYSFLVCLQLPTHFFVCTTLLK